MVRNVAGAFITKLVLEENMSKEQWGHGYCKGYDDAMHEKQHLIKACENCQWGAIATWNGKIYTECRLSKNKPMPENLHGFERMKHYISTLPLNCEDFEPLI